MKKHRTDPLKTKKQTRLLLGIFIAGLVVSGLTAFPVEWELGLMHGHESHLSGAFREWYEKISDGVIQNRMHHPFMAYGTDWLGFAHIVIALFFIPVFRNPARYLANVEIGLIACLGVFPLAFIFGTFRGIPFFWQLIDCSFGLFGGILLLLIRRKIKQIIIR